MLSSTVHARQTVRGVGVFTAFEDGRVRVRFNDRTIVSVDRWHRAADVLHRDGSRGAVSVRSRLLLALLRVRHSRRHCTSTAATR